MRDDDGVMMMCMMDDIHEQETCIHAVDAFRREDEGDSANVQ